VSLRQSVALLVGAAARIGNGIRALRLVEPKTGVFTIC